MAALVCAHCGKEYFDNVREALIAAAAVRGDGGDSSGVAASGSVAPQPDLPIGELPAPRTQAFVTSGELERRRQGRLSRHRERS